MITNGLKYKIKSLSEGAEFLNIKEMLVIDYDIPQSSVSVHVCIECTETGKYLITESDVEAPVLSLQIPNELKELLMIDSVHDWEKELNELHYHIVSTKALTSKQLLRCIKFFFTINQYFK